MKNFTRLVMTLIALTSSSLFSAETLNSQLEKCASVKSDLQRLACFDLLAGRAGSAPQEQLSARSKQAMENRSTAATVPSQTAKTAEDNFGMTGRNQPEKDVVESEFGLKSDGGDESLVSYIPGEFKGWKNGDEIELANGQIWQIKDPQGRLVHSGYNLKVTIKQGVFDSYRMSVQGVNKSARVVRVK